GILDRRNAVAHRALHVAGDRDGAAGIADQFPLGVVECAAMHIRCVGAERLFGVEILQEAGGAGRGDADVALRCAFQEFPDHLRQAAARFRRTGCPPDRWALWTRDQSKPGGGTKPMMSFSMKRLKAIAVLSRPLAAIA